MQTGRGASGRTNAHDEGSTRDGVDTDISERLKPRANDQRELYNDDHPAHALARALHAHQDADGHGSTNGDSSALLDAVEVLARPGLAVYSPMF